MTSTTETTYRLFITGKEPYGLTTTSQDELIAYAIQEVQSGEQVYYSEDGGEIQPVPRNWCSQELFEMAEFHACLPQGHFLNYNAKDRQYELCNGSSDSIVATAENLNQGAFIQNLIDRAGLGDLGTDSSWGVYSTDSVDWHRLADSQGTIFGKFADIVNFFEAIALEGLDLKTEWGWEQIWSKAQDFEGIYNSIPEQC